MATQKIEENFNHNRSDRYDGLICEVEFRISRDGSISDIRVVKSTGQGSLDRFALDAVRQTARLGPLPDSVRDSSIVIRARFDYGS